MVFTRRQSAVRCFFCHSNTQSSRDPYNFRCQACGCWNRYDAKGEILSDEPAMHDESLNSRSFARRGSRSKNRLPNLYGSGPFCHTCQTNQMLLVNLLSNYLPAPTSPEYEARLQMLPQYRESLHVRYPPVCSNCLPGIEEEIRRKDSMARSTALRGWLDKTKGKERERRVSGTLQQREQLTKHILMWRIRGFLWVLTLTFCLCGYVLGSLGYAMPSFMERLVFKLPYLTLLSIFWNYWDPTFSSVHQARIRGHEVRVQGKEPYIRLQTLSLLLRAVTVALLSVCAYTPAFDLLHLCSVPLSNRSRFYFTFCFVLELGVVISSLSVLRVKKPPTVRLVDSKSRALSPQASDDSHATPPPPSMPPSTQEPDLFASLTLSNKPVVTGPNSNPVFGLPSFGGLNPPPADPDAMDWSPTDSSQPAPSQASPGDFMLRPQRFFPPEQPTGLEDLFQKTRLSDTGYRDVQMADLTSNPIETITRFCRQWGPHIVLGVFAVGLVVGAKVLMSRWGITIAFTSGEAAVRLSQPTASSIPPSVESYDL